MIGVKSIKYEDHKTHQHQLHGRQLLCFTCQVWGFAVDVQSKRKPFNSDAGYIASLRSGKDKGWIVVYDAREAGFDQEGGRYAVACMTHHTVVNAKNLPDARVIMKNPDFCEECGVI